MSCCLKARARRRGELYIHHYIYYYIYHCGGPEAGVRVLEELLSEGASATLRRVSL